MRVLAALLALACLALPCSALVVGRATAPARPLAAGRALPRMMPSKEDKEFEEWVRKKKIASGVDPDEDFATGRAAESAWGAGSHGVHRVNPRVARWRVSVSASGKARVSVEKS